MPTKTLADFLPEVLPDVKNCPAIIARNAVRNALIEFCERSKVYRQELDRLTIFAEEPLYEIDLPSQTTIAEVESVLYNGVPIDPKSPLDLDLELPGWQLQSGDVSGYFMNDPTTIRLVLTPTVNLSQGLCVTAALKPTRAATAVESWLWERYLEQIAHGAKWKLMAMKDKDWTSAARAEMHKAAFDKACGAANVSGAAGMSRAPLRVRAVYAMD